jgi:hypothetical protein
MCRRPGRFRPVRRFRSPFVSLIVLCLIGNSVEGSERTSVDASQLRGILVNREPEVHSIEVKLKDGSVVKGKLLELGGNALSVGAPVGERLVPYEQVSAVNLDLGPSRGWRIAGGVIGAFVVGSIAGFATSESSTAKHNASTLAGTGAGAVLGALLGGRHPKILVIEVK